MTSLPGYPTPARLRAQAAAAVTASLPTVSSINNQYGQSESDNAGFSAALLAQLRGEAGTAGNAYQSALSQQSAVNAAAQARLGKLGGGYAAGSQAAVGGLGDSAMSRLINNQAAETAFASQEPSVAAARASLAQAALVKSQQQALQQRSDEYRSAYGNALQTAEDNALQRSTALANLGMDQTRLRMENSQINNQAQEAANNLAEQKREFGINNAYRYAALAASAGGGTGAPKSALARSLGITQNEFLDRVQDATQLLAGSQPETARVPVYGPNGHITGYNIKTVGGSGQPSAIQAGVPFATAVNLLIQQGTQPQIAVYTAAQQYRGSKQQNFHAWVSFVQWMANHGNKQYARTWNQIRPNPVPQTRGHG